MMARYVQVGVMAQRDPMTQEVVEEVPLYVDTDIKPYVPMSDTERKALVKDLARKFREAMRKENLRESEAS